jgi:LmbE family N-acetylglucosaminyl deacetylase
MRPISLLPILHVAAASVLAAQQLAPPSSGGVAVVDRALRTLDQDKRVLVIAAHPDDEDTQLLTLLSRGHGVDAAYLALSRGEGGQNLIGPELGEGLGLIRTGELLAARSTDGARQYFTRAFDFGFSKSLAETERFWPHDTLLADVVRVIRRLRPQVLVAVFSGTPRDGHGQHQMSGVLAREAFLLLRDSAWGPRKLYRTTRFDSGQTTVQLAAGALDPVVGQSFAQIAMASRSLHRSQDMGQIQRVGPAVVRLGLVEGAEARGHGGTERGIFDGVDTSLAPGLERYAALVDSARQLLNPRGLGRVVPVLAAALDELRRRAPEPFRAAKEPVLMEAIAAAAGIVVDGAAEDGRIVGGQVVSVTVSVWNAGRSDVEVAAVEVEVPEGWAVRPEPWGPAALRGDALLARRFDVTPPEDAPLSEPYFLARPRLAGLYDWSEVPEALRGLPHAPPPARAVVRLTVAGAPIVLAREVSHRYVDQASGEIRKPLFVVPRVGIAVTPELVVWPVTSAAPRAVTVELTHGARGRTSGLLRLEVPEGWPEVAPQPFSLEGEDTRRSAAFLVRAPRGMRPGSYTLRVVADVEGRRYDRATMVLDYPHIRPVAVVREAMVRVAAVDLVLPRLRRVGYVRGASDQVPEALLTLGVPLTILAGDGLERADLSAYDVIVIGSRAYETDPVLLANNARLVDWVRGGGRLIVQYQQYQFVRGAFAPLPLRIAAPHDRVTDEGAPMQPLDPAHPVFTRPNRITGADWDGWVQERGLYFAREWDAAYRPLLETGDDGERLRGGLLVAPLGRGLYVYTGLSFFRQLPAGVPGAFRLFLNLLALEARDVR